MSKSRGYRKTVVSMNDERIAMENGPFLGIYDDLPMKNCAFP